jgi:hypothetical protein
MPWCFIAAGALFHLAVLAVGWRLLRHAVRGPGASAACEVRSLARSALVFLATAATLAMPAAAWAHDPFFAWVRLVCQALFGEGTLLLLAGSVLHGARGNRRLSFGLGLMTLLLLATYWEAYHYGPSRLQVRSLEVPLERTPLAREIRVLHMSDIQTHSIGEHERRAVRAGLALRPDVVVLTGDYLQPRLAPLEPAARPAMRALLRALRARYGVYAVPGDTDRGCELFEGLHVRCLEDASVRVALGDGQRLTLTGLRPRTSRTSDPAVLGSVLSQAPPADLHLVIGHSPDYVRALALSSGVDLALAGHTHGGQVALPFIGPLVTLSQLPRRYAGGLQDYRGIPLHVSRGVGLERGSAPPIRFFCPPEVTLLRIVPAPTQGGVRAGDAPDPRGRRRAAWIVDH